LKTGRDDRPEGSPLGLDKWLPAVWMIANMKNSVSSHELARSLGMTRNPAWFMLQCIRHAMQVASLPAPMESKAAGYAHDKPDALACDEAT
jgi:hypothetical protein